MSFVHQLKNGLFKKRCPPLHFEEFPMSSAGQTQQKALLRGAVAAVVGAGPCHVWTGGGAGAEGSAHASPGIAAVQLRWGRGIWEVWQYQLVWVLSEYPSALFFVVNFPTCWLP